MCHVSPLLAGQAKGNILQLLPEYGVVSLAQVVQVDAEIVEVFPSNLWFKGPYY